MKFLLIEEENINNRIDELEKEVKQFGNLTTGQLLLNTLIKELQSLKQKGEEVEVEEITDDDLTHNSLEFLRNNGYKLIKTKL